VHIEAGKTTALVGPSGSGKSTVIQLLERFYNPNSGSITVDGKPIQSLDLRSFRQAVGYVGQEPVLFNQSIKENMLYAKPTATDSEIRQALEDANAWSFVSKLPDTFNASVGAGGGRLSGGQKQRVAIARAFLKQPKVLLLDEATSALDNANERKVQEAIDRYKAKIGNLTVIVIAHRLSTVRDADKIVVIKDGVKIEEGNHQHLLDTYPSGIYAHLVELDARTQAQEEDADEGDLDDSPVPELQ